MDKEFQEVVKHIALDKLRPFKNHPFTILNDESMIQTAKSVRQYGFMVPAIARPLEDSTYELILEHKREPACELAVLRTMPINVKNIDRMQR